VFLVASFVGTIDWAVELSFSGAVRARVFAVFMTIQAFGYDTEIVEILLAWKITIVEFVATIAIAHDITSLGRVNC